MSDVESLTADDLRSKLYHSLREKGLVDTLKSQLRNRLVTELRHVGLSQSFPRSQAKLSDEGSLVLRAANSLVADHLRRTNYDYTLSVFLPESSTAEEKVFTTRDLLQLLSISPQSTLYQNLAKYNQDSLDKKGFLWQLLSEIAKQHGNSKRETGMQTEKGSMPFTTSLHEEFQKLDEYYSSAEAAKGSRWAVEERMLSYQRQLEERGRTEINLEISRFKETELTRMRLEEREKCRKEMERARKEMERTYQAKVDALVERERHSIDRLQQQQQIQEKETFAQRQSILEEIEVVRQREGELHRQMELNKREKNLWEDKMKSREELVKRREETVKRGEIEYEQHLNYEISKYKTEQEARYLQRNKDLEYREVRLKEDERRIGEELADIKQVKDELREKRIKVNTLDGDLQRAQHDLLSSRNQNELMSEKIRDMVDYQVLKDDNIGRKRELDNIKMRLSENQRDLQIERQKREELLREMGDRLSKPTPETLLVQGELEKARSSLRHEQALYQHQQQQGQIRFTEQVDRNRELLRKYEEQSMQMKEMNRELTDMRHQLTHTRSALDNEVYGKPKSSLRRSRSPSMCDVHDQPLLDDFVDRGTDAGVFSTTEPELFFTKDIEDEPVSIGAGVSRADDYSYSSDLVEDTKKRLRNLEREAENLEQNYRNFHFRMTSVPSSVPATVIPLPAANDAKSSFMGEIRAKAPSRGNTNHSARPAYNSPRATLTRSPDRPLSSTPNRKPSSYPRPYTPPTLDDLPRMDMSVSTVHSDSPDAGRSTAVRSNRPISLNDLEARPGSPSVVVVEGSVSHLPNTTHPDNAGDRTSPPGQERSERSDTKGIALDTAWKKSPLDQAWKTGDDPNEPKNLQDTHNEVKGHGSDGDSTHGQRSDDDLSERTPLTSTQNRALLLESTRQTQTESEAERRRREAEEDRKYEEQRRQREEDRKRREERAWAEEQEELERLQNGQTRPSDRVKEEETKEEDEKGSAEHSIDPVMQKYMEMVQAQKDKEKEPGKVLAKKTVSTWNKGRTLSTDKTPSVTEELSGADDKSDNGAVALDDFDW